jgi:hypothetical protein
MDIAAIKRETERLLVGLESGNLNASDAFAICEKLDPILTFFVVKFLRANYPATNPASQAVLGRILELTTYPSVTAACRAGERDPMNEWFDDDLGVHKLARNPRQFVELLVEKVEG